LVILLVIGGDATQIAAKPGITEFESSVALRIARTASTGESLFVVG